MPTPIGRDEVQRLLENGAQLVEVLPEDEYEDEHLPGAISIPLKSLDAESTGRLERERPVIVYCYDYQCDMSPRAAARLESVGFTEVYDYVAGKADWGSFGLPIAGRRDSGARAGAHARADVPVCGLGGTLSEVWDRDANGGWDTCFVVDDRRVVLGRLGRSALARDDDASVEEAMTPGPRTVRPSLELDEAARRMQAQNLSSLPVTHSDGVLVGVLRREDADRALARSGRETTGRDSTPAPLSPGTPAPQFELSSAPDRRVSLAELRGRPLILAFYPGDWSPVCSDQMALYQELLPEFERFEARLLGLSVDSAWSHLAFARDRNLHFPLLADFDPKGEVARAYGAYRESDGTSERALFVIDAEGIVRWSYVSPVSVNPGADGILRALERLVKEGDS